VRRSSAQRPGRFYRVRFTAVTTATMMTPKARRLSGVNAGGLLAMLRFVQAGLVWTVGHIRSLP
jgi:hypothetical protein